MSIGFYKLLHLVSLMIVFAALGGLSVAAGSKQKLLSAMHGIGMLGLLVAGFGLLARLGFVQGGLPHWALAKLGVWVVLGAWPVVFRKAPSVARLSLLFAIALGFAAAYLGNVKAI